MKTRGIDWSLADWSMRDSELARSHGVNESTVRRARARRVDAEPDTNRRPTVMEGAAQRADTAPSRRDNEAYAPTFPEEPIEVVAAQSLKLPPVPGDPKRDPWLHAVGAPDGYHLHSVTTLPDGSQSHATRIGDRSTPAELQPSVPGHHYVRGVSTLVDGDGAVVLQWIKTDAKRDAEMSSLMSALSRIAEPLRGERDPVPAPKRADDDLLVFIPWGDPHIGQHSWPAETGEAWDLEIAERVHVEATQRLIDVAPAAARCHLALLGDNLHANDASARTPKSGHALDVDSRFPKVLDVTARSVRRCIDLALLKFAEVDATILPGNHDPTASAALAYILAALYEREPRVTVDKSPAKYRCVEWGANLIGLAHGDTRRVAEMNGLMPALWPRAWGRTRHRHWYTGHIHHDRLIELQDGSTAESMRTMAAKDAYAAAGGFTSGRDMKCDVIHRERGRINRHYIGIESLRGVA